MNAFWGREWPRGHALQNELFPSTQEMLAPRAQLPIHSIQRRTGHHSHSQRKLRGRSTSLFFEDLLTRTSIDIILTFLAIQMKQRFVYFDRV